MTKSELIAVLTERQAHLSVKDIEDGVKYIFEIMRQTLIKGERIEIRGFGSFSLRYREARDARNPKTGEAVNIHGKYAVHFKPGKELKEQVNNAN